MTPNSIWSDIRGLDVSQWLQRAGRVLPPWISLLLVVVIGWQLATVFWSLMPGSSAGDAVAVPASVANSAGRQSAENVDINAIAGAHLFGVADAEAPQEVVQQEITEDLPDTRLTNLTLKGTLAATDSKDSIAIIADSGNKQLIYFVGDPVTSGAKLHAVYRDRVVLNESGRLTNLELPKDFVASSSPPVRRIATSSKKAAEDTNNIQSVVANNISALSDVIRPTPYFVNGEQQGYRVYPGRDRRQFAALGLRPGDLIKDIDGQALSDPSQAMKIFQSLGTADQVSVTVERNGQPQTLVLKTSQLEMGDEQTQ
ncbi:MAG: type II secretion system protein GspC [Woeseiaceae bacterium]